MLTYPKWKEQREQRARKTKAVVYGLVAAATLAITLLAGCAWTQRTNAPAAQRALDLVAGVYGASWLSRLHVQQLPSSCRAGDRPGYLTTPKRNCVVGSVPSGDCRQANVAWVPGMTWAASGLPEAAMDAMACGLYGSPRAWDSDTTAMDLVTSARKALERAGL